MQHRLSVIALCAWISTLTLACGSDEEPVRIAVVLPLSDNSGWGFMGPLQWAVDNVNAAGGVAGRTLELVPFDLDQIDAETAIQMVLDDDSITGVIGPHTSDLAFEAARRFRKAHRVMVTPTATSSDFYRAFAGKDPPYIWRTVGSDMAQTRVMVSIAQEHEQSLRGSGALLPQHKLQVALLAPTGRYGSTFVHWFPFFATEADFGIVGVEEYGADSQDSDTAVEKVFGMCDQGLCPDVLFAVAVGATQSAQISAFAIQNHPGCLVLFSDGADNQDFVQEVIALGADPDGIEGTALAADPTCGFDVAYRVLFEKERPPPFAANLYDAVLLLSYGLEVSNGAGGEALATALAQVVSGDGEATGWYGDGIRKAMELLRQGAKPNVRGATGPLTYEEGQFVDLTAYTYGRWRIEAGIPVTTAHVSAHLAGRDERDSETLGVSRQSSSDSMETLAGSGEVTPPPSRTGMKALLIAGSEGCANYRHQSDVIAVYHLLRSNGVDPEDIVLVLADDANDSACSSDPGAAENDTVVRNATDGVNLYEAIEEIDYHPCDLEPGDVYSLLLGDDANGKLHKVLHGTDGENLLIYVASHGGEKGVCLTCGDQCPDHRLVTPAGLRETLAMARDYGLFRKALVVIEACRSGNMGHLAGYDAQPVEHVLVVTAANPFESSFSWNYDSQLDIWLADEFSYHFWDIAENFPDTSLYDLYGYLYSTVWGSHVSAYNYSAFGDLHQDLLQEYISP